MAYLNTVAGTAREGGLSTAAIDAGALAASTAGRAIMAASFFNAATVADKFGADSLTAANLAQLIQDDAFAATAAIRALFATGLFDAATVDDLIATGAIGEDRLTAAELTGRALAVVANANVIGGVPVLHRIDVPAGVTGDVDTVLTHKTRICEAWLVKTAAAGGGAGTVQLKNGANAITDAMDINITDQAITRATTIDDAQHEIAAAGTLRITRTRTGSTDESCTVYVLAVRVA